MLFIDRRLRVAAISSKKNLCGCLRAFIVVPLKVYLHNKTITSLNVSYKAQVNLFFYFAEKLCSIFKIFKFCIFNDPMICQICDVMMSIST